MDTDINLAPALERVTASVAETQRRRLDLERELGEAQHVIASLKNQSSALEMSLLDLQKQLDETLAIKSDEDTALTEIARQKEAALRDLAALRASIDALVAEKERTSDAVSTAMVYVSNKIESVQANIDSTSKAAGAIAGEVAHLRERINGVRELAELADRQLTDVQDKSSAVNNAVALLRSDADRIASGLTDVSQRKRDADTAGAQLEALMAALQQQRGEAEKATESMRKAIESRRQQTEAISAQMQAMSRLIAAAPSASNAEQPSIASAPAGSNGVQSGEASSEPTTAAETAEAAEPALPHINAPAHTSFERTAATVKLLGAEEFLAPGEAARIVSLLEEGEVNKVVRSLWSRAVGGLTPAVYRLIIADAFNESGDFKAAMTFYNQALATRHIDPFLTYLIAVSLFSAAKSEEALKLAKVLAREKSGRVLSRNIEAIYYMRSGKLDEAERRLKEAVAIPGSAHSHYHETLYNMATLHQKKGDAAASLTWFEKLKASDPSYRDMQSHMAIAHS